MHGLEHGRVLALRVQIPRWSNSNRADDGGAEVGENIAEKIRAYDDVKPVGVAHEMRRENVHVKLIRADARKLFRDGGESLVPKRHGVDDAVRFRGGRNVLSTALRQLECKTHHAVAAPLGKYRLLHRDFIFGTAE